VKLSARNQIKGIITEVEEGAVSAIVTIDAEGTPITATISNAAVKELGLAAGMEAYAVIKATSVLIATDVGKISARNRFAGIVEEVEAGAVQSFVTLRTAVGTSIRATISNSAVQDLGLKAGDAATAVVKATDVMVGIDS